MDCEIKHLECEKHSLKAKIIVGIEVKTSNAPGESEKDIPALWDRFMTDNIQDQIPNKADSTVYGIYTHYEGDHTAPYTVIIGCEVTELPDELPEGLMTHTTPACTYAHIPMTGSFPEGVMKAWQSVWCSDLERSFTSDFEAYDETFNPANGCQGSNLYIAIK